MTGGEPVNRRRPFGPVRILCAGNPLRGDDGFGIAVYGCLSVGALPEGVEAVEVGTGGAAVLDALDGARAAILVDAASFGLAPGAIRRVAGEELSRVEAGASPSSHMDLGFALALTRELGRLPPTTAYLVQAGSVDPGLGLSPPVARAVPVVVHRVRDEARALAAVPWPPGRHRPLP